METLSPFSNIPSQLEQIPEGVPVVFVSYSWDNQTLIEAANNLIHEGYCIYEAQPSGFFKLTQKGYDRIYKGTS